MVLRDVLETWRHLTALEAAEEESRYNEIVREISAAAAEKCGRAILYTTIVEEGPIWYGGLSLVVKNEEKVMKAETEEWGSQATFRIGEIIELREAVRSQCVKSHSLSSFPLVTEGLIHDICSSESGGLISMVIVVDNGNEGLLTSLFAKKEAIEVHISLSSNSCTTNRRYEIIERLANPPIDPDGQRRLFNWLSDPQKYGSLAHSSSLWKTRHLGNLNSSQRAAAEFCLRHSPATYIHGPPGTGKTVTLAAIIHELVSRNLKVLVATPSNIALDNIMELLKARNLDCLRLGHPSRVSKDLWDSTFAARASQSPSAQECDNISRAIRCTKAEETKKQMVPALRAKLKVAQDKMISEVFSRSPVVLATCTGSLALPMRQYFDLTGIMRRDNLFDVVVIDEAGQAFEVDAWIPIWLGKKVILAGDPKQLGPCTQSVTAATLFLGSSLLNRITIEAPKMSQMLTIQYRMNQQIMQWPSEVFYDGKLEADASVANHVVHPLLQPMLWFDTDVSPNARESPTLRVNRTSKGTIVNRKFNSSKCNKCEAILVAKYLRDNLLPFVRNIENIAVITPYKRQVSLIKKEIYKELAEKNSTFAILKKTKVATVDGFQGKEATVVILSLVRSNTKHMIGFVANPERLNVALTRARMHCLIIGSISTFSRDPHFQSLIEYIRSMRQPEDVALKIDLSVPTVRPKPFERMLPSTMQDKKGNWFDDLRDEENETTTIGESDTYASPSPADFVTVTEGALRTPVDKMGGAMTLQDALYVMRNTLQEGQSVTFSKISGDDICHWEDAASELGLRSKAKMEFNKWVLHVSRPARGSAIEQRMTSSPSNKFTDNQDYQSFSDELEHYSTESHSGHIDRTSERLADFSGIEEKCKFTHSTTQMVVIEDEEIACRMSFFPTCCK